MADERLIAQASGLVLADIAAGSGHFQLNLYQPRLDAKIARGRLCQAACG